MRHFLSPQLAELVLGEESLLQSHRREIVVVFADLRNFTPFAETSEPEEVMAVLERIPPGHRARWCTPTKARSSGSPVTGSWCSSTIPFPAMTPPSARSACRWRSGCGQRTGHRWRRNGHDLALGIGIAQGYATLGRIGFEGRFDYSAIGSVTNLAARLCSDARGWQVLVTDRVLAAVEHLSCDSEIVGDMQPKGFSRSVRVHNVRSIQEGTP